MKIGVISDTHLSKPSTGLYNLMAGVFSDISLILHAGDLTSLDVLDAFSGKKVIAVCGNMDHYDVTRKLPSEKIVEIEGHRIGLTHGWGSPGGVEDRVKDKFRDVDAIVYGHTHRPANHSEAGVLFFNPGAFSGSFPFKRNRSVGLLTIDSRISGTIINL